MRMREKILKAFLDLMIIVGSIYFCILMWGYKDRVELRNLKGYIILIIFSIGFISIISIILNLRKITISIIEKNSFVRLNVVRIKRVAVSCGVVSVCYFINMIFGRGISKLKFIRIDELGIHTDFDCLIFLVAACFIYILALVFEKAVEYKEENDLCV